MRTSMLPRTFTSLVAMLVLAVLCLPARGLAQSTTGAITGVATDETKSILPGVTITVTNVETGIARTVVTDARGAYRVTDLAPGSYEVQGALSVQSTVHKGILLTVGREAAVDLSLRIGSVTEEVVVSGDAPLVDVRGQSGPGRGQQVDQRPAAQRPRRHRADGAADGHGATRIGGKDEEGSGIRYSVGGMRPNTNVMLLDGVALETASGYTPTGSSQNFLGAEAVREFKVETNAYSADFGRNSGGVMNVVTKSGTNAFHGSVFEFHRDDALDAKNFFDDEKPPFSRDQFGLSLGGRVLRNKTFFFGTYEGFRERLGITTIARTLTAAARNGNLGGQTVAVDPRVAPYLTLWPLPTGPIADHGDGTGDFTYVQSQPTDEHYAQAPLDHQFSPSDSVFARYTRHQSERLRIDSFPQYRTSTEIQNQFLAAEYKKIFSPSLLTNFRFGHTAADVNEFAEQDAVSPSLRFVPSVPLVGTLTVAGVTGVGSGNSGDHQIIYSSQYSADTTYARGQHSLKFGANWNHLRIDGFNPARDAGEYEFGSIADFFRATPSRFRGAIVEGYNDPNRDISFNIIGALRAGGSAGGFAPDLERGRPLRVRHRADRKEGRIGNFRGDLAFIQKASIADISPATPGSRTRRSETSRRDSGLRGMSRAAAAPRSAALGSSICSSISPGFRPRRTDAAVPRIEMQAAGNIPFPNILPVLPRVRSARHDARYAVRRAIRTGFDAVQLHHAPRGAVQRQRPAPVVQPAGGDGRVCGIARDRSSRVR